MIWLTIDRYSLVVHDSRAVCLANTKANSARDALDVADAVVDVVLSGAEMCTNEAERAIVVTGGN